MWKVMGYWIALTSQINYFTPNVIQSSKPINIPTIIAFLFIVVSKSKENISERLSMIHPINEL